jgi:predicted flap endonuclease-1-like 5' DNA nuclease
MWVRMVRPVVAGRQPRRVNAVVELSEAEAQTLILAGSAVASAPPPAPSTGSSSGASRPPHLVGVEHAVDANAMTAERRNAPTNWGEALVSDLDGVGPVTAGLLAEAGINTMADLLAADAAQVALLARVSPARAEKWRQRAATIVAGVP